jgi:hypothetical protein
VIAGRRRTDVPDALVRGAAELSDHPTQAGRDSSDRRRDGRLVPGADHDRRPAQRPVPGVVAGNPHRADGARQISRSRLPLPPVPAATRASSPVPPLPAAPAAPLTSAAPFRAVPTGQSRPGIVERESLETARAGAPSLEGPPSRPARASAPAPRVPRQTSRDDAPSDDFEEWIPAARAFGPDAGRRQPAGALLVRPAPATTVIPERSVAGRGGRSADLVEDEAPIGVRGPVTGSGAGPVGGRAAMRAERQAADMARRKAVKRSGGPVSVIPEDEDDEPRRPRRVVKGLLAMVVVGLGVLGVYSYVSPPPQDAAAQKPVVSSPAPSVAPSTQLPALPAEPVAVEPTVTVPVRVPVTVLNATDINGLAGRISSTIVGAGWESPGVGAYTDDDISVTTVFFTEGDENQRQAALQLIEQFPQITGPAPRFFELPADVTAPGLVVVAAGEWQP